MASFLSKPIPQLSSFAGGSFIGLILGVILLALGSAFFPVPFASLIPGMPLLIIGALIVEKFSLLILGIQSINPLRTLYKGDVRAYRIFACDVMEKAICIHKDCLSWDNFIHDLTPCCWICFFAGCKRGRVHGLRNVFSNNDLSTPAAG